MAENTNNWPSGDVADDIGEDGNPVPSPSYLDGDPEPAATAPAAPDEDDSDG